MPIPRCLVVILVSISLFWGCSSDSDNGGDSNVDDTGVTTAEVVQSNDTLPDSTTSPDTVTSLHTAPPSHTTSSSGTTPSSDVVAASDITASSDTAAPPITRLSADDSVSSPPATTLDLSYVSADFGLAIILRPAAILGTDLAARLPTDLVSDQVIQKTTIDPHNLEQVVVLLALPEGVEEYFAPAADEESEFEPPGPVTGVILRTRTPYDKTKLLQSIFGEDVPQPVEHDGKAYYRNEFDPSVFLPDEVTAVVATTSVLPSMMSAADVDSPLTRQLKITDADHDAVLVAVVEPFREKLKKITAVAELPPPVTDAMDTLVFNAAALTLYADVAGDHLCSLKLRGQDDVGARNLEAFVRTWLESVMEMFADTKDELAADTPLNLGGPLVTVVEQAIAGTRMGRKGLEVVAVVERPTSLDDVVRQIGPAIRAALNPSDTAPNGD